MRRIPASVAAVMLTMLLGSCTPSVPATGPLPVAGVAVQAWRARLDNQQSRLVYVRNDTERPILVTSFQIYSCVNVREECTTYLPNVQVPPHQAVIAMRVDPIQPSSEPIFGYSYKWEHLSAPPPVPLVNIDEFRAAVAAIDRDGTCVPATVAARVPGGSTLTMVFGPADRPVRRVQLELDSLARPHYYSDARGDLRPPAGAADPTAPPVGMRTTISIDVSSTSASVAYEGDGSARESFSAHGANVLTAASLGVPEQMIRRLVQECSRH